MNPVLLPCIVLLQSAPELAVDNSSWLILYLSPPPRLPADQANIEEKQSDMSPITPTRRIKQQYSVG